MEVGRACNLSKIKPGAKMRALAMEHDGADILRQIHKVTAQALYGFIVERIALFRTREAQDRNGTVA